MKKIFAVAVLAASVALAGFSSFPVSTTMGSNSTYSTTRTISGLIRSVEVNTATNMAVYITTSNGIGASISGSKYIYTNASLNGSVSSNITSGPILIRDTVIVVCTNANSNANFKAVVIYKY